MTPQRPQRRRKQFRYKPPQLSAAMMCREAFCTIARGCLHDLAANAQAAHQGDREAVHQMRIALTRLRATRSFFLPIIPLGEWAELRKELKWLNRHLSKVRDLDVAMERLHGAREQDGSSGQIWQKAWSVRRGQLMHALGSKRYRTLIQKASNWINRLAKSPADPQASHKRHAPPLLTYCLCRLGRWHRKLVKQGHGLKQMTSSQRHRFRKKIKRMRYAIEFLGALLPPESLPREKMLLRLLRRIQKRLGHLNDAEQGFLLATTLAEANHNDIPEWHSVFSTSRKAEKRIIEAARSAVRQMEHLRRFNNNPFSSNGCQ